MSFSTIDFADWATILWTVRLTKSQVGATKNVAWRFHTDNIRCNGVLPGGAQLNPFRLLGFVLIPTGVATNIASSVQMEQFDSAGFNSFLYVHYSRAVPKTDFDSPIVQLHVSKDSEGTPVPVIGVDDVARGIAFLASDEAKMINGAMIPIDNAWSTI